MNGRPLEPQAEATCRPAVRGENVELTGDEPDRTRTLARQQGRGKATSEGGSTKPVPISETARIQLWAYFENFLGAAPALPRAGSDTELDHLVSVHNLSRSQVSRQFDKYRCARRSGDEVDFFAARGHDALSAAAHQRRGFGIDGTLRNRLHSVAKDSEFVRRVSQGFNPRLPLCANLRCGAWYAPKEHRSCDVYFKSTDGHAGGWALSLRRLNMHLIPLVVQHGGAVIVDSTRRGRPLSDALAKTIPIWAACVNRAVAQYRTEKGAEKRAVQGVSGESWDAETRCKGLGTIKEGGRRERAIEQAVERCTSALCTQHSVGEEGRWATEEKDVWCTSLHTPPSVGEGERASIEERLDSMVRSLLESGVDLESIARAMHKPLRTLWVVPSREGRVRWLGAGLVCAAANAGPAATQIAQDMPAVAGEGEDCCPGAGLNDAETENGHPESEKSQNASEASSDGGGSRCLVTGPGNETASDDTLEYSSNCVDTSSLPYYPLVCVSASAAVDRERLQAYTYLQGAADDDDFWAPRGFDSELFWKHSKELLEAGSDEECLAIASRLGNAALVSQCHLEGIGQGGRTGMSAWEVASSGEANGGACSDAIFKGQSAHHLQLTFSGVGALGTSDATGQCPVDMEQSPADTDTQTLATLQASSHSFDQSRARSSGQKNKQTLAAPHAASDTPNDVTEDRHGQDEEASGRTSADFQRPSTDIKVHEYVERDQFTVHNSPDPNDTYFDWIKDTGIAVGSRRAARPPMCWQNFDAILNVTPENFHVMPADEGDDNDHVSSPACRDQLRAHEGLRESIDIASAERPALADVIHDVDGRKCLYLQLHVIEGKRDNHMLEQKLPQAIRFAAQHLSQKRRILVHCAQGKDRSVAVAVAILATLFDADAKFKKEDPLLEAIQTLNDQKLRACVALDRTHGKQRLLRCLQWVSAARPVVAPSRHTLKKLHHFFMSADISKDSPSPGHHRDTS